jgi:hypothetical protein
MDISTLSPTDRDILRHALRLLRADEVENQEEAANRNATDAKLQDGIGQLDEMERHLLIVSIITTTQDNDLFYHFNALLGL